MINCVVKENDIKECHLFAKVLNLKLMSVFAVIHLAVSHCYFDVGLETCGLGLGKSLVYITVQKYC